ncbi:alpha/beta hydrolase [Kineosporia rhizophila]|uniref:RBBP9/YdeN family alpha/beta hydrolase n=1 Tax=Kineosporia TaxID=49184 RepID=UPI001E32C953|nr:MULTISPECIES: alpha/beta hydrolase [Kineosporia]MCE0535371.1 alpha/beta hydrolase [Kineosporia rhizophila]GLY16849.1 hypothetical protein Kisp01_38640 [Kineosporia sp. NBRC 101677]
MDGPLRPHNLVAPGPAALIDRVVVLHGYGATPDDHWFGWLSQELTALGIATRVPALPEPQAPEAEAWLAATAAAVGPVDARTHLVAHSLGCLTLLRHLATLPADPGTWELGGLTLVAGFTGPLPALPQLDGYLADPITGDVSDEALQRIATRTRRLRVLRSDNDALVPAEATDALAQRLGTVAQIVPQAGHFLADDGVTTLPAVLEHVTG